MATTYEIISKTTVGSGGSASIDFTSIPQTYTDLCIKYSGRTDNGQTSNHILMQLNGSSSSLTGIRLGGNGSSVYTASVTTGPAGHSSGSASTANTFGSSEIYIPNYTGATNKSWSADGVSENNGTSAAAELNVGLWSNTSAITSIKLLPEGGASFVQHSTAYLYGIKKN